MAIFRKKRIKATKSLKSLYSQGIFLKRLGQLLLEGFSMKNALIFLSTTGNTHHRDWILAIQEGLQEGGTLHDQLKDLNFSDQVCSQIYFSMIHGQYAQTIHECGVQLLAKMERKKNLKQILTYPIMLIVFMVGMLFAMRYILLPHITQLTTSGSSHLSMGTTLVLVIIRESPVVIVLTTCLSVLFVILFQLYLSEKSAIETSSILAAIPVLKPLLQLYYTQFLAMEWGQLIKHGTHLREITEIMKTDTSSKLVNELGIEIAQNLQKGRTFKESVSEFTFLKPEMNNIIDFGEQSSDLGKELLLYSKQCEEELQLLIEKIMTLIQPIIFIGIGVMIVSIYAALLLPTFSLLNGM